MKRRLKTGQVPALCCRTLRTKKTGSVTTVTGTANPSTTVLNGPKASCRVAERIRCTLSGTMIHQKRPAFQARYPLSGQEHRRQATAVAASLDAPLTGASPPATRRTRPATNHTRAWKSTGCFQVIVLSGFKGTAGFTFAFILCRTYFHSIGRMEMKTMIAMTYSMCRSMPGMVRPRK